MMSNNFNPLSANVQGGGVPYSFGSWVNAQQRSDPEGIPAGDPSKSKNWDWVDTILDTGVNVLDILKGRRGETVIIKEADPQTRQTNNTALYIGLGIGGLILIILLLNFLKK